jgi:YjbE family integral membrane protein
MLGGHLLSWLTALAAVVVIDVTLAADNAVVVGMAAAGLPAEGRRRAIVVGIAAAAVMRIGFAVFALQLMEIVGLVLAGGLLLLWVSWKLWREIRGGDAAREAAAAEPGRVKTFRQAVTQIVIADLSMSLDNILAVAGAAHRHVDVLIVGLIGSVVLMGFAATLVARLLLRWSWLAYVGLLTVVAVALRMIWEGGHAVLAGLV